MQTIEQELEFNVNWATEVFRQEGELLPVALIDGDNGRVPVIMSFETPDQKDKNYALITLLATAFDATQIVMLSESWVTTLRDDGSVERRVEALIVSVVRRDGERTAILEIQRDAKGGFAGLRPDPDQDAYITSESRIRESLPKTPVSDEKKQAARGMLKLLQDFGRVTDRMGKDEPVPNKSKMH